MSGDVWHKPCLLSDPIERSPALSDPETLYGFRPALFAALRHFEYVYPVSCDKRLNDVLGDCSSRGLTAATTMGRLDEQCLPFSLTSDPVVSNLFTCPSIVFRLGGLRTPNSLWYAL